MPPKLEQLSSARDSVHLEILAQNSVPADQHGVGGPQATLAEPRGVLRRRNPSLWSVAAGALGSATADVTAVRLVQATAYRSVSATPGQGSGENRESSYSRLTPVGGSIASAVRIRHAGLPGDSNYAGPH